MNPESPIDDKQTKSNAGAEADKQSNSPKPEISSAAAKSQATPPPHSYKITCKKERDWKDNATLFLEGCGLFVLIVYTVATIVYACITNNMWREMQTQTRNAERPWVGIDEISIVEDSFVVQNKGERATISLTYNLINGGRSPAYVFIQGNIFESTRELEAGKRTDTGEAESQCNSGKANFSRHPMTSIPSIPTVYGIAYDGQESDSTSERMKDIPLTIAADPDNSKHHFLVHVGCILYQSAGKGDIRQTPFKAYLWIRDPKDTKHPFKVHGPWVIGKAD